METFAVFVRRAVAAGDRIAAGRQEQGIRESRIRSLIVEFRSRFS